MPHLDVKCIMYYVYSLNTNAMVSNATRLHHHNVLLPGTFLEGLIYSSSLTHIKAGDAVQVPLERVSDWLISMHTGEVYGGFTIQQIRKRMNVQEGYEHDGAWGMDFGDPETVRLPHENVEHPMSEAMGPSIAKHLGANPASLSQADPHGATFLHEMALGGSLACVKVLLDVGADRSAKTVHGDTPRDLAIRMGWDRVADLLA